MRGDWRVAVVMPAYNEEEQIEATICSVPKWVDLLVVIDDGSQDNTADVVIILFTHGYRNLGQGW